LHLLLTCVTSSKLAASKVVNEGAEQGPDGAAPIHPAVSEEDLPLVQLHGTFIAPPVAEEHVVEGRTIKLRGLHDELQLTYIHGLVAVDEIASMVKMADERSGWVRSPLKSQESGSCLEEDKRRTSSSCPMIWPLLYSEADLASKPQVLAERRLASVVGSRVARLFSATGMPLTEAHIEPLQLVRYQPGERFGPHHDYHASGESSVQGEQRAFTVLVFGSTITPHDGGETHFPHLNVSVWPRAGDALAWANVDAEGEPNPRSLHEGRPPRAGEKVAINVWVANTAFSVERGLDRAVRT